MFRNIAAGAALASLAAAAAEADVTPRQVWEDWIAAAEADAASYGTGSVEEDGGRLVVTDLAMTLLTEKGGYALTVDEVVFAQNGDGTVSVTMSPGYVVTLTGETEDGTATEARLRIDHPELEMIVSGDEAERRHAYAAPELTITLLEATEGGEPVDLAGALTLSDVAGTYDVNDGAAPRDSSLIAARAEARMSGDDPEGDGTFELDLVIDDVRADNLTAFFEGEMTEESLALQDGAARSGMLRFGPLSYTLATEGGEAGAATIAGTSRSGELTASLSEEGLRYGAVNRDSALTLSGDRIPFPQLRMSMAETAATLAMPVLPSDEAQRFDAEVRLLDLKLDESLWSMIDPAGILPRDPATLVVDVTGEAVLDRNLLQASESVPEIEALDIEELRLSLAGAELVGKGAMEFRDGSTAAMPQPVGTLDLRLTGGLALIERLVQMGLIPQEQAMGARMMISMFSRPGPGQDELLSTIRFTEDGQVLVNDQRIQ
ncbi:DUF2125 domain-containing protein [Roseitranquillus sediminis]|uniref:DUF2125 domain-containing protein n=1 Tax=Roseitranquillus sediminis TaxID=2809051 RepID=UPI001D0C8F9C|nr:DUF2125 domain-containing protein [Roseitranquillus sediminis]MBM9596178.1 DUF2125 domain-containing protein [Roseitranquillus sediminis]